MDVLILVADGIVYDRFDYATRIEDRLSDAGLTAERYDLTTPDDKPLPPARSYLFTGGATSVSSTEPWMRAAISTAGRLIETADRVGHAVVGICLGSQIIAEVLQPGSTVASSAIEVGLAAVTRPDDDQTERFVPSFHYESISPALAGVDGVKVEWCSSRSTIEAFSYGASTWACQFHPELSVTDLHRLIDFNVETIRTWHGDVEAARHSVDSHARDLPADLFATTVLAHLR